MTLAFLGTAVWGYQENQEKNAVLIKAENQYQRAFHDLSYHMEQLQSEMGKTIAANSDSSDYYRRGLANVWRLASQAQNEINQLPLTLLPFNNTEEFLSNISNFTYRTAVRDLTKNPLSPDEQNTLQELYKRSKEMTSQLQDVQSKVLNQNLRWMDVETALATQSKQMDNTIVDGFKTVDKKVQEYGELNWGPTMATLYQKRSYGTLPGMEINGDEAKAKAAQFVQAQDANALQVTENGGGTEYSSFTVRGKHPYYGQDMQLDLTKKGGHIIYYMAARDVQEKNIDIKGAREAAQEFLDAHELRDMVPVNYDEYENVASFTFAHKVGNVTVYPEKIVVKVALDNAEVTGMQASDYLYEQKSRTFTAPSLSEEQARKELNPSFQNESVTLAWIKNDLDQEVLCYEFTGKINGSGYRIYINGDTGLEEKIEEFRLDGK
ncbi:germination protein YpeB [Gorillibacterium sp. sgz5001074]|uniref:germination protein YpeB n=1 Tax=Gorillibacterium sp. sgz5001074 TaxID=3446695 RepID=UPI003F662422